MILKDIYLYPELTEYDIALTSKFREQTRSLCNFLGRHIKPAKIRCDKYNRVCFVCRKHPVTHSYVNSSGVLRVEVFFDMQEYLSKQDNNLNEYFISLVMDGVNRCDNVDFPKKLIMEGANLFRALNYKNEWVFKEKTFKKNRGLKAILKCRLTMTHFYLDLYVTKKGDAIFHENIKTEVPEEVIFGYHLKDLIVKDNGDIQVIDKLNRMIYSKNIDRELYLNRA